MGDGQPQALDAIAFTCPKCGGTSNDPMDVLEQYCGACHEWFNNYGPMHFDRAGKPINFTHWSDLYNDFGYVSVAETFRGNTRISTMWLGLDHSFGFGPPRIFETAVFGADGSLYVPGRYCTERDAIKGHRIAVRWITRTAPFSNPRPLSLAGRVVSRKHHARKKKR